MGTRALRGSVPGPVLEDPVPRLHVPPLPKMREWLHVVLGLGALTKVATWGHCSHTSLPITTAGQEVALLREMPS